MQPPTPGEEARTGVWLLAAALVASCAALYNQYKFTQDNDQQQALRRHSSTGSSGHGGGLADMFDVSVDDDFMLLSSDHDESKPAANNKPAQTLKPSSSFQKLTSLSSRYLHKMPPIQTRQFVDYSIQTQFQ